ncbi:MAG: xylulokinase [Anaerolineales bacterium]|nr:xylulokinase [Anaerolineales bacterium]
MTTYLNYFMGIDLGTSGMKVLLLSPEDHSRFLSYQSLEIQVPQPFFAEQNPEDWAKACAFAVRDIISQAGIQGNQIGGISFSGQMHGLVCLDNNYNPLRPAIIWVDQRSSTQVSKVLDQVGIDRYSAITGNSLQPGFLLSSWLWVRDNQPELFDKIRYVMTPKDYLRLIFCGEIAMDPSDACATGLLNIRSGKWSDEILNRLSLPIERLPEIIPSDSIAGSLLPAIAQQVGLSQGIPIITGGGDTPVQALANGVISSDLTSCSISTSGQLFNPTPNLIVDHKNRLHSFSHVTPGGRYLMGAVLAAGLSLKWFSENILENRYSYQELADHASFTKACENLYFLPHLTGARSPEMDPGSAAGFSGLQYHHTHREMTRAIMEGVVFSLKQCQDVFLEVGIFSKQVVASGGGSTHPFWLSLIANILGKPVVMSLSKETAALGAAMLAAIGCGYYPGFQEAVDHLSIWSPEVICPDEQLVRFYDEKYQSYSRLYRAQKFVQNGVFHEK